MMGKHGSMVSVVPTAICSVLPQPKWTSLVHRRPLVWNLAYVHSNTETLLSSLYCKIDDTVTSLSFIISGCVFFFLVLIFQAQFAASTQVPPVLWSATSYLQFNCVQELLWLECPCCTFFKVLRDQCLVPPEMEKGQEFSSLQWNRKGQFDFSQMSSR